MDLHTCLLLGSFPCNSFTKTKWGKQNIRVPSCALFSSISIHVFGNSTSSRQKWCPHEAIWRSQILIMSLKQSSTHFPRNNHGTSHCNCHDDRASLCKLWEQQSSHCFFLVIGSAIRWRTCYQKMWRQCCGQQVQQAFLRPRQEDHLASDTKELCWSSVEVSFHLGFSSLHLLRTSAASRFDPSGLPFYFLGYPRMPARYSDNI